MPLSLEQVRQSIVSCDRCPRLRQYCQRIAREKKAAYRDQTYWGKPVPGFGDPNARVLILGLAPAAHGANRTGRVFTGDGVGGSGDFLMRALHRHGFASIPISRHPADGLTLSDAFIAAAVRCAPPDNKPNPDEIAACQDHLAAEIDALPRIQIVVALGKIAFDAYWQLLGRRGVTIRPRPAFGHGRVHRYDGAPIVIASYHPSRQNTNTGKLTPGMMDAIFRKARKTVSGPLNSSPAGVD